MSQLIPQVLLGRSPAPTAQLSARILNISTILPTATHCRKERVALYFRCMGKTDPVADGLPRVPSTPVEGEQHPHPAWKAQETNLEAVLSQASPLHHGHDGQGAAAHKTFSCSPPPREG